MISQVRNGPYTITKTLVLQGVVCNAIIFILLFFFKKNFFTSAISQNTVPTMRFPYTRGINAAPINNGGLPGDRLPFPRKVSN